MKLTHKGQGLSMNVIIIAAIALLVLVILAVLLFRQSGNITQATSCGGSVYNGECKMRCGSSEVPLPEGSCPQEQKCCVPIDQQQQA